MSNSQAHPSNQSDVVLVVDDDPQIVRLIRSYLEQAGFHVEAAGNGDTALAAARSLRPSLIILDLGLPGKDGLEVTRIIRTDPLLSALPILMLTARVDDVDRILGLEMGADDYVTKPFNPREVTARVKAILRRSRQPADSNAVESIRVGDLLVDPAAHTVTVADRPLDLTPSEFDILYLLMRQPNRAFSRTEIIELALGYEYAGLERTVDSHIKNLRRKLAPFSLDSPRIETVFGVGYRLAAD